MDEMLRSLLFKKFQFGKYSFDFLEALLAVCITGVGFLLRTPFETGLPKWYFLLAEWYLAFAGATFIWYETKSRKKSLGVYAVLMILPTIVAEGTILQGDACIGALLLLCALLFLQRGQTWLFTFVVAVLCLFSVKYTGLFFACIVLWQKKELDIKQLGILFFAWILRFFVAYRAYFAAKYSLVTFHWPNIYEIVGRESIKGQLIDPIALVGIFLALGLLVLAVYLCSLGVWKIQTLVCLRLFLFFGLAGAYFLPYANQSFGYVFCILAVLYVFLKPREFIVAMLLQIITFAAYQECFHGASMMPMALFAAIQFLLIAYLGVQLLQDAGIIRLWNQKN